MTAGTWIVLGLGVAFFAYTRLVGKVSPAHARQLVQGGARLVDVRSPGEYASGHLDGAVNIPVDQLARRADELGPRDQPLVLYCASGMRSASAKRTLSGLGFTQVADLGPMSRWPS